MPDAAPPAPGSFCWMELATTDQDAAKAFYASLFGWTFDDQPMGEGMPPYTTLLKDGRKAGALYLKGKEQENVPPYWGSYVAVASADETAARAKELGATLLMEPFDVFDFGRMCAFVDPTGAVLSIWQSKTHNGIETGFEPNAYCWAELQTGDTGKARAFYEGLFGWTSKTDSGATPYTEWMNAGHPIGGMMKLPMEGVPPHWMIYFSVDDCDDTTARATALGARTYMPPTDIPKAGRFSVLADPQGAAFAVIKLQMPG